MDLKGQGLALAPSQGKLAICPLDGVGRDPGVIDGPGCDHSLKGPDLSGFVLKYIGSYRKYAMAKIFFARIAIVIHVICATYLEDYSDFVGLPIFDFF